MAADEPFYLDDVSSIESSSQRERKFSEEVIQSLTHAVQRLADTLETKEAELVTKEAVIELKEAELETKEAVLEIQAAELQTQAAELQLKDRLENKVLDLMLENAELKGQAAEQDTPPRTDRQALPSKEGSSSLQHRPVDDKENGENVVSDDSLAVSTVTKAPLGKPPLGRRRSSGPSLSKLMPRKLLPKPVSGLSGRSLFTTQKRSKGSGVPPKLIPRHISALPGSSSDEVSDLSSM